MRLTTLLMRIEKHGARLALEGTQVAVDGMEKLPEELIRAARQNKALLSHYLQLTTSATVLGRFIDTDPANGSRLPEFEELHDQIIALEKTVIETPQEVRK